MNNTLYLNVVDSDREIFHGKVSDVTLSGTMGSFTVLAGHAPLLSSLKPGEIHYSGLDGQYESLFVSGGIVEVQPSLVTVLADTITRSEELDAEAAKESIERAKQRMKSVQIGTAAYEDLLKEMQIMKALLEMTRSSRHRIGR